jgi:hypothetical protein
MRVVAPEQLNRYDQQRAVIILGKELDGITFKVAPTRRSVSVYMRVVETFDLVFHVPEHDL